MASDRSRKFGFSQHAQRLVVYNTKKTLKKINYKFLSNRLTTEVVKISNILRYDDFASEGEKNVEKITKILKKHTIT